MPAYHKLKAHLIRVGVKIAYDYVRKTIVDGYKINATIKSIKGALSGKLVLKCDDYLGPQLVVMAAVDQRHPELGGQPDSTTSRLTALENDVAQIKQSMATKQDLEQLKQAMATKQDELKQAMATKQDELKQDLEELKNELHSVVRRQD
ncbi:hypothetical protein RCL1_006591 [Eukaryota sp. TZLM3-RCL]